MKLSEFPEVITGGLFRDGVFSNIGMLYQEKPNILCPINSAEYLSDMNANNSISCLITNEEVTKEIPENIGIWVSPNPLESFFQLHNYLLYKTDFYGNHFSSLIPKNCSIACNAQISADNIILNDNVMIDNYAIIRGKTEIGKNSKISSYVSIGDDGFEVKIIDGISSIIEHAGGVIIGKNVEIHSFSAIDCGLFDEKTFIGDNVKIDKYVHIAHNSTVLENTIICSSSKIMGSSFIGRNVFISLGVMINNRVKIGNNCFIGPGEVVLEDVPANTRLIDGKINGI